MFLNTFFWSIPLFSIALLKFLVPIRSFQAQINRILNFIAACWIDSNRLIYFLLLRVTFEIEGVEDLSLNGWYLVLSNHQSWIDVLVLQRVFNHKIPFLKFFLKKNLIWVPLLGQAWWAMDMPFMQRYSKEFLKEHPELKGRDLETTRKACDKFKDTPVSVINFVEGTRFSPEKQKRKNSSYKYLLPPKAGGVAFTLGAMGKLFQKIIDVTIYYPEGKLKLWDFACGRISRIVVRVRVLDVPAQWTQGNYLEDEGFQKEFQLWLNELWAEKDELLSQMR